MPFDLTAAVSYIGIVAFAVAGALKARSYRMDVFGALVLAFANAYAGGTLRDVLIGVRPISWINNNNALLLVFGAVAAAFVLKDHHHKFRRTIFLTDAVGLGAFTAAGIDIAQAHGLNGAYVVVMGVITATFGGLIADILCNEVPHLLRPGELYATVSALGGIVYVILGKLGLGNDVNLTVCLVVVVLLRVVSKYKRLSLPGI